MLKSWKACDSLTSSKYTLFQGAFGARWVHNGAQLVRDAAVVCFRVPVAPPCLCEYARANSPPLPKYPFGCFCFSRQTLEEFCEAQAVQRDYLDMELQRFSLNVRETVMKACEDTLYNFLQNAGFNVKVRRYIKCIEP